MSQCCAHQEPAGLGGKAYERLLPFPSLLRLCMSLMQCPELLSCTLVAMPVGREHQRNSRG